MERTNRHAEPTPGGAAIRRTIEFSTESTQHESLGILLVLHTPQANDASYYLMNEQQFEYSANVLLLLVLSSSTANDTGIFY